ncbi:hypothetical protein [Streptomyces albus]|uniref:hypothetical protein n=1 Tax=Streptomyces albus TaxID=1888 RepID=UPI003F1DD845
MAVIDHHTVVVGSTGDQHTFVLLNRPVPAAHRILTEQGLTFRRGPGRPVYLLPPEAAGAEAHRAVATAIHRLLDHTTDFIDLSATARIAHHPPASLTAPAARFDLAHPRARTTTTDPLAGALLQRQGFRPADGGYLLPGHLPEPARIAAVVLADFALDRAGATSLISLGLPTPADIPPTPTQARHTGHQLPRHATPHRTTAPRPAP